METCPVIKSEEYIRLLWWAVIGFTRILNGENPKATAQKYLDGLTQLLKDAGEEEYDIKLKKLCKKSKQTLDIF